jgi:membrane associated rhomboid family serine protease
VGALRWARCPGLPDSGGIIAAIVSGSFIDQLTEAGQAGIFVGSLVHVVGLITALVAGIIMFREGAMRPSLSIGEQPTS